MKKLNFSKLRKYLPFILVLLAIACCFPSIAVVGNQNRYDTGSNGGGDFDLGVLIGWLINLFIQSPVLGLIAVVVIIIAYRIMKKKSKDTDYINKNVNNQANSEVTMDYSGVVAEEIRAIDPDFSSDKFIGFAREVFMTIQQAWTAKDWKPIRPFESEALFNQHKQQLDEYIRLGKTNVVEKIAIKHCSLHSFKQDGDKEVLTVWLNAVMRDYVIDDKTKKVLESDPRQERQYHHQLPQLRRAARNHLIGTMRLLRQRHHQRRTRLGVDRHSFAELMYGCHNVTALQQKRLNN